MTRPRPLQVRSRHLAAPWQGALAQLADELGRRGVEARLLSSEEWLPHLEVRKPGTLHTEKIYAEPGWFCWPWGECLGRQVASAAASVAVFLGLDNGGGPGA